MCHNCWRICQRPRRRAVRRRVAVETVGPPGRCKGRDGGQGAVRTVIASALIATHARQYIRGRRRHGRVHVPQRVGDRLPGAEVSPAPGTGGHMPPHRHRRAGVEYACDVQRQEISDVMAPCLVCYRVTSLSFYPRCTATVSRMSPRAEGWAGPFVCHRQGWRGASRRSRRRGGLGGGVTRSCRRRTRTRRGMASADHALPTTKCSIIYLRRIVV